MDNALSIGELKIEINKRLSNARIDFIKRLYDRRPVVEQYLDGDCDIHVHFTTGIHRWCANYISCRAAGVSVKGDAPSDVDESVVLVEVVEVPEHRDPVASLVRLQTLDHCNMGFVDALEVGVTPSGEAIGVAFNRELSARWLSISSQEGKSVDEIIQRAAEIVTNFTNQNRAGDWDRKGRPLADTRPYEEIVRRIRIKLGYEAVFVLFGDDVQFFPQITKVFLCPVYSPAGAIKAVAGCGSLHA